MKQVIAVLVTVLCLFLTACNEKYTLVDDIPDAENSIITSTGRLFVTGGTNIYEVFPDGTAAALCDEGRYNFTGMAEVAGHLYAIGTQILRSPAEGCGAIDPLSASAVYAECVGRLLVRSVLLCAPLQPGNLVFSEIYTFQEMFIPNGMVGDSAGHLYVANETFIPRGKIIRLTLSGPTTVASQETWLDGDQGVYSPNGMAIKGNRIYFTDFDLRSEKQASVKCVQIKSDGTPGPVETLYARIGLFDDLSAGTASGNDVIAVADFFKGSVVIIKDNGKLQASPLYETSGAMFACPSSVRFGKGPDYSPSELIVTEKGLMYEHASDYGNKVSGMLLE